MLETDLIKLSIFTVKINIKYIRHYIQPLKYLTIRKLYNQILLWFSYSISRFKIILFRKISPSFLSVEITNYCNLRCPECPVGLRRTSKQDKSTFDFSLYKQLIKELKPTLQHVILYFQGEPLLNNELPKFIEYAHHAKIYTSTSTNAQLLTKDYARLLVLSGLDKLIISVDGSTQFTYEQYRVGGKLDKVLDGIRFIDEWKQELKSLTPLVEMQFLVLRSNELQLDEMRELAKELHVDKLTFKSSQILDFEDGNQLIPEIHTSYSRYKKLPNGKYVFKGKLPNRCRRLWTGAVVNVQGDVLPCCYDKSSEHSFGNIRKKSFTACWESSSADLFRRKILCNRKQFEICRNCVN